MVLSTRVTEAVAAEIDQLAATEERRVSDMVRLLIRDGLRVRRGQGSTPDAMVSAVEAAIAAGADFSVGPHEFTPSKRNALRCVCGRKKAGH